MQHGALAIDLGPRFRAFDVLQHGENMGIIGARLNTQCALAYRIGKQFGGHDFGLVGAHIQPLQARMSQDHGIKSVLALNARQTRADIAANGNHIDIGAQAENLRLAPQGSGADGRALFEIGQSGAAQDIACILALGHSGQNKPFGQIGRQIFQ